MMKIRDKISIYISDGGGNKMMKGIPSFSVSVYVHISELCIQKENNSFFTNCASLIPYKLFQASHGGLESNIPQSTNKALFNNPHLGALDSKGDLFVLYKLC
jgi:hypothetical protein